MAGGRLMSARPGQRGVVLLSVLLVLALLSAIAWQLVGRHSLVIAQARFSFTSDQALEYALGAEALARQLLYQEWLEGDQSRDTLLEPWAQPIAPMTLDNGFMEIQVRDLNGCFNLNSLAGESSQENLERFKRLLRNLNQPEAIAEAWKDWVDADEEVTGFGAEDGEYLLLDTPYRTANAPAAHLSELRLVRGLEEDSLKVLLPELCVLPETELRLNVNTASAAVMAALDPNLSATQLIPFAESERDYGDVESVTAEFPDLAAAVDAMSVTSEYFEIQIRAQVEDTRSELTSVLRRNRDDGRVELISRDFGKDFRSLFVADLEPGSEPG
jgi:general secretion pathway protein K